MPGLGFWDTGEFQTLGPVLGIAHPTGYPSYVPAAVAGVRAAPAVRRPGTAREPAVGAARLGRRRPRRRGGRPGHASRGHRPRRGRARWRWRPSRGRTRSAPIPTALHLFLARAAAGAAARLGHPGAWRATACRPLAGGRGRLLRRLARQSRPDAAAGARASRCSCWPSRPGSCGSSGGWCWRALAALVADHGRCCTPTSPSAPRCTRRSTTPIPTDLGELQLPRLRPAVHGHLPRHAVAGGRRSGRSGRCSRRTWASRPGRSLVGLVGGHLAAAPADAPDRPLVRAAGVVPAGLRERGHRPLLPGAHHGRRGVGRPRARLGLGRGTARLAPAATRRAARRPTLAPRVITASARRACCWCRCWRAVPDRFDDADASGDTGAREWLDATLAALEPDPVVISWWSYSTPLWYGRWVEGARPDMTIIDDRTMLDEHSARPAARTSVAAHA